MDWGRLISSGADALGQVLVVGLILGAGLPAMFAVAIRTLTTNGTLVTARQAGWDLTGPAAGGLASVVDPPRPRRHVAWRRWVSSPALNWHVLTTKQIWVLLAVADGRVRRLLEYGELAQHELDGQPVSWTISALAVHRLVLIDPLRPGPPRITRRGRQVLRDAGLVPDDSRPG